MSTEPFSECGRWSWDRILVWYCRFITLQLTIVRQRDKLEGWFKHFLVEDKGINPAATSYVDFLCQMHKEIRNLMNWSICGYSSLTTKKELGRLCKWRQERCVKNSPQFSRWLEMAALKRLLVFWVMVRRLTSTENGWLTRRLYDCDWKCTISVFFFLSQLHSAYAAVLNIYCLWVLLALVAFTCHRRC